MNGKRQRTTGIAKKPRKKSNGAKTGLPVNPGALTTESGIAEPELLENEMDTPLVDPALLEQATPPSGSADMLASLKGLAGTKKRSIKPKTTIRKKTAAPKQEVENEAIPHSFKGEKEESTAEIEVTDHDEYVTDFPQEPVRSLPPQVSQKKKTIPKRQDVEVSPVVQKSQVRLARNVRAEQEDRKRYVDRIREETRAYLLQLAQEREARLANRNY